MKGEITKRNRRRVWLVLAVVIIFMSALAVRVYSIQVIQGPMYAAMARSQQRIALSGVDKRGEICDRNGEPLTGSMLEYVYILRSNRMTGGAETLLKRLEARERRTSNEKYRIFSSVEYDKEAAEKLRREYGAYIMQTPQRYQKDQPAIYLLGYVRDSDGVGIAGLERVFDEELSRREQVMYGVADAANQIVPGYGIQNSRERDVRLYTTLEKPLQEQLEEIVNGVDEGRACAIITDVESGDVLASATAPGFDPFVVEELLESQEEELFDIALQGQYPPGSVFKIVVAAAVLEQGVYDAEDTFLCSGAAVLGDVVVGCTAEDGHGELNMKEAFAKSCNCAFIQMGQTIGADAILDMAQKFGFGREVFIDLDMDRPGNLPSKEDSAGPGIANLSIGQGTLLVTPIQVAQMTQIVAAGGLDTGLWLADRLEDGDSVRELQRQIPRRILSEGTAAELLEMMRSTVKYGTARGLSDWDCAGKTGSAEGYLDGETAVHSWFTGVVPSETPRFTITVFVEGGGTGGTVAAPVFEQILEILESGS